MKEIEINKALEATNGLLFIDLTSKEPGYEEYDFHIGSKCNINGHTFTLMAENGILSFEASAIALTSVSRKAPKLHLNFSCGETVIIFVYDGAPHAYEVTLPERVSWQSFRID